MKKVSLFVKFSTLYFISLLIIITILAKVIVVSNSALVATAAASFILFGLTVAFIYREITIPIRNLFRFSDKLKASDEENAFSMFDSKINDLNILLGNLDKFVRESVTSKEISKISCELYSITERILLELKTAKHFKVNRNEFLGNVAHELRTPIFAIQLSLETLLDGAINDEKVNLEFLKKAFNQTNRLKELVDDLISISKFETGMKMSKRYFNLGNMLKKVIDELKALADNKKINFIFDAENLNGLMVFGDEERLKQVMVNLIDNAIKYTNKDGEIRIGAAINGKEALVYVEDNGIGIPRKDLPRIFERFYRVDKTRSRDVGGSGLGLSIVKHILEAHSSKINVTSEENNGTRFEFNLQR